MNEKNIQKCLDHLVDFQIAIKICCKTIGSKAKRNERYSSQQNWTREKHLNKQIVQSLHDCEICALNIACHCMPKYFWSVIEKHSKKHNLFLRHGEHHTPIFWYDKGCYWVLQFLTHLFFDMT